MEDVIAGRNSVGEALKSGRPLENLLGLPRIKAFWYRKSSRSAWRSWLPVKGIKA